MSCPSSSSNTKIYTMDCEHLSSVVIGIANAAATPDGSQSASSDHCLCHGVPQVLKINGRLTELIVQLPAAVNASAAASSILQQAHELLSSNPDNEQPEPDYAESHLLTYTGNLQYGRCKVSAVDAATTLTDSWFSSNELLVLLLPESPAAAAAGPAKAGSKRKQPEPDPAAAGEQYMLVFNSVLAEGSDHRQLPFLLKMPELADRSGTEQDKAVCGAVQVSCMHQCVAKSGIGTVCFLQLIKQ